MVEYLPGKCKALSSNLSTGERERERERERNREIDSGFTSLIGNESLRATCSLRKSFPPSLLPSFPSFFPFLHSSKQCMCHEQLISAKMRKAQCLFGGLLLEGLTDTDMTHFIKPLVQQSG
jgi:hypothetical protein